MRSIRFIVIFLLTGLPFSGLAQTSSLEIKGNVDDLNTGAGLTGVVVSVYKNGSLVESQTTGSGGKYKFKKFDAEGTITVKFSKSGYVGKYAEIDVSGIHPEDAGIFPLEVSTSLFEEVENVDFSVLDNQPVAKAKYNKGVDNIEWDMKYIEATRKKVEKITADAEAQKKKQEAAKAAEIKKFNDAVAAGNAAMAKGDYAGAIKNFSDALSVKNDDADVKKKLAEAEEKKKVADAEAATNKQYNDLMAEAKKAFDTKDYGSAKSKYQDALKVKPNEAAPKDQIKVIDDILAKQIENDNKYNKFLSDGEKALNTENYDEAIKQFTEAGKMRPNEALPKEQLKKAQDAKAKADKEKAEQAKKDADFANFVKLGDNAGAAKKYDDAIINYDKALAIKDDPAVKAKKDAAVKAKEAEVKAKQEEEAKIAEEKRKQKEFDDLMAKGSGELTAKEFDKAIASFESALTIKPKEPTAEAKLAEAKKKKADQDAADKLAKEKEAQLKQFNELIAKGDGEAKAERYDNAISSYKDALNIFPNDAGAKTKLADAEAKKAAIAKQQADFDNLVKTGDNNVTAKKYDEAVASYDKALAIKDDAGVKAKKDAAIKAKADAAAAEQKALAEQKKRDEFEKLMAKGNGELSGQKYDEAIASFTTALTVIPKEPTAEAKLAEAKQKKADKEANEKALAEKAAKQKQFDEFMASGDASMKTESFDAAIKSYKDALGIFSDNATAKSKLADAEAKKTAKEKQEAALKDQAAKRKQFDELIAKGDGEMSSSQFDNAISSYTSALSIFPNDATAKAKLADAQKKKAEADKLAKDKEAAEKAKREKYLQHYNAGTSASTTGDFDKAISEFEAALVIIPGDKDATNGLNEAKRRKKENEDQIAQQYNMRLQAADKAFDEEKYEEAKGHYVKLNKLKPDDQHVKNRIKECDDKIKEKELADKEAQKKRASYEAAKNTADALFAQSKWDDAIKQYEVALTFLDEQYPKDQIEKAKTNKTNALNAEAAEKQKKADFDALVKKGDGEVKSEDFDAAISSYTSALALYPNDVPVKNKLADTQSKKTAKEKADAEAAAKNQKLKQFNDLIAKGDGELSATKYNDAIGSYTAALGLFPNDATAKAKLADAQKKKAEADKLAKDKDAAEKAKREQYLQHYNAGTNSSTTGDFDKAISEFEAALVIIPGDKDATNGLNEAKRRKKENEDQIAQQYNMRLQAADKAFDEGKYEEAKGHYIKLNKLKPDDQHVKNRIKECDAKMADANEMQKLKASFDAAIANGDAELKKKNFDKAISFYESAKIILPKETLPDEKIAEAKRLKKLAEEDSRLADKRKTFDKYMNEGNGFMTTGDFDPAIEKFEAALGVIPNEPSAVKALELAKQRKKERDDEIEREIKRILEAADKEFAASNWKDALKYYERYDKKRPGDPYVASQIAKCKAKIKESTSDNTNAKNYDALIKEGNKLFSEKKWMDSKSKFQEALGIYNMEYPKKKIEEIDKILADLAQQRQDQNNQDKLEQSKKLRQGPNYGEKTLMSADDALALLYDAKFRDDLDKYEKIRTKKETISKTNSSLDSSSFAGRSENYDMIGDQKELYKDFSTNTDTRDENTEFYKKRKEQQDTETRLWTSENDLTEGNKNRVNELKDRLDMNQYEERIRFINSVDVNNEKDQLSLRNQMIDDESATTRNENGKELVDKKDELNDRYSANGKQQIERNSNEIKSDHDNVVAFNKKQKETADNIRNQNSIELNREKDELIEQNKFSQEKLMTENSNRTKDAFALQQSVNQQIDVQSNSVRTANSKDLNQRKDDFVEQNKFVTDRLMKENGETIHNKHDDQANVNKEMYSTAETIRKQNSDELNADKDEFIETQRSIQQRLLSENGNEVKAKNDLLSERNKQIDEQSSTIRNKNSEYLNGQKDMLSDNTNSTEQRLLNENGEEIKTEKDELQARNKLIDNQSNSTRNQNSEDLNEQKDNLKNMYTKGGESQAEKIRQMKETQDAMVAAQRKNDNAAQKSRWTAGDNIHTQRDSALVYSKGQDGYKSQYTVDFPQGVTEEVYTKKDYDGNVGEVTIRRIVVKGDYGNEYRKVVSKTGEVYFKNNKIITRQQWDMETSK